MNKHMLKRLERALKPVKPGQVFVFGDGKTEEEERKLQEEYDRLSNEEKKRCLVIQVCYGSPGEDDTENDE